MKQILKKMKTLISALLSLMLLFCIQNPIIATTTLNDTIPLEEVVVTGSKVELNRNLVPVSVSQISSKEIENTGEINILPTISLYVPGVFVTERNILGMGVSTGGAGYINIRGVGGSPNTEVLLLIDGHPQYQGIFGHPLPDAYVASDVEKVEVIRGPASILYGSNAMGGAVNIITKEPKEDGLNGNLNASYGSYNTQKYAGTIGYKTGKFEVFGSVNHDQTDGIRDSTDFKITNGFVKVGYSINENLKLTADLSLADFNANDMGSVYEDPEPFNIDIQRGKTSVSLENHYDKVDGAFKFYYNFGEHNLSDGWHSTDRNTGIMLYQTLRLFKGNSLTAGIDLKQYGGEGNSGMNSDTLLTVNEVAGYVYMQQTLLKKLTISAGVRVENNSVFGTELIPMGGINFNPTTTTTFKGSVSKGYRSPTIKELYLFAPNPELEPERMINYEVSWLQSAFNARLKTELTVFLSNGDNLIQTTGVYPNKTTENLGAFTNKGIEIAVKYKVLDDLFLHANYSYLTSDTTLLAAPEHQVNISANYTYSIFNFNLSTQHIQNLYTSTDPEDIQSYSLLNARVSAQVIKNLSIFVSANNLLNEEYEINYGYPMPKINFSGGLKLTFL